MTKNIFTLLILLLIGGYVIAQKSDQKLSKAERKAIEKAELVENHSALLEVIENKSFVVEADLLRDRYGRTIVVSNVTNFLAVVDEDATIQLAVGNGFGFNGLGGVTLDGRLTEFEIKDKGPEKGIFVKLRVFGTPVGTTDVFMDVYGDGRANIRFVTLRGSRFSMDGWIYPMEQSNVYKGQTTY